MGRLAAYRVLCGALGAPLVLLGAVLVVAFFQFHLPGMEPPGPPLGPWSAYLAAFAGCALVAWGAALVAAARRPALARGIGTATALGLVLAAVTRMFGWVMGDYAALGDLLRLEAAVFLLLALGFVWLRPPHLEVR